MEAVEYLVVNGAHVAVANDINWFTPLHLLVQPSIGSALLTEIMPNPKQFTIVNQWLLPWQSLCVMPMQTLTPKIARVTPLSIRG